LVLCGGQSRRMGRDKARVELEGQTLLERAVAAVSGALATLEADPRGVCLACGPVPRYADFRLPLALDQRADAGPLAGLEAGLAAVPAGLVITLACDMPRVDAGWLARLCSRARSDALDVCWLAGARGVEPLCAVYDTAILPCVRAALDAGQLKMTSLADHPKADGRLPRCAAVLYSELSGEIAGGPVLADPTTNLNTPDELARERAHRSAERGARARGESAR
jgi:molybdopterin-guanine dinucleotide biosynthesis protein A